MTQNNERENGDHKHGVGAHRYTCQDGHAYDCSGLHKNDELGDGQQEARCTCPLMNVISYWGSAKYYTLWACVGTGRANDAC